MTPLSKRVESISTQIARAIKFQREIILNAEREIHRLRGLYVHASPTPRKRAPNGTFDRTKYQRELMRKRRAEARGQAGKAADR